MDRKSLKWQIPFLVLLIAGTVLILRKQPPFHTDQGLVFGTIYKITYQYADNLKPEIEAVLKKVDNSLSPFNKASVITRINNNTDMTADSLLNDVYLLAKNISEETGGAFDITVAPLVNAWGFGFDSSTDVSRRTIDSLRQFVGFEKISLKDGRIIKQDDRTMLDCGAIAKGYGVDRIADFLESKGIENYMIDIGGELRLKGKNSKMKTWRIGINKPIDDSLSVNQELQTVMEISGCGLATSGNYRNFYYKDGKKYAHTINPRTGYPVQHNILSSTVVAGNCATADGYATAFMVLGLDSAVAFCNAHPEIDAYFIYSDDKDSTRVFYTEGMKRFIRNR